MQIIVAMAPAALMVGCMVALGTPPIVDALMAVGCFINGAIINNMVVTKQRLKAINGIT